MLEFSTIIASIHPFGANDGGPCGEHTSCQTTKGRQAASRRWLRLDVPRPADALPADVTAAISTTFGPLAFEYVSSGGIHKGR
jgi:hypothetical protein